MQSYKQRAKGCDVVVGSRDIVKLFIVPLFIGKTGKWWGRGKDNCTVVKLVKGWVTTTW